MLHLGLVVLPEQPHVGVVVHPLWTLGERLQHVGTPTQALPYLLGPSQGPVHLVLALALVAEVVAVPAQEILSLSVQNGHSLSAGHSRTDEPGPFSPEIARRPLQGYRLHHFLPLATWSAAVAVGEDEVVPVDESSDGSHLSPRSRPDRKSTRLNSSHTVISYAVFCLKKKKKQKTHSLLKQKQKKKQKNQ